MFLSGLGVQDMVPALMGLLALYAALFVLQRYLRKTLRGSAHAHKDSHDT